MNRLKILLILLLMSNKILFAQDQKTSVAIMPFVYASPDYRNRASQLQEIIIGILSTKSDINLLDRSKDTLLIRELTDQTRETSMLSPTLVQQGKVLGAQNMIIGTLSNVSTNQQTNKVKNILTGKLNATTVYTASISFSLQLTDVESGKIINQKAFNSEQSGLFGMGGIITGNSPEDAMANAMTFEKKQILTWINQCYPPNIKILKIEDRDKKGNPETILITGVDASLEKGTKLDLNEIEMIDAGDGKQLRRAVNIAKLKITDKQDEITVCKITEGGKALEDKMNANSKLEVVVK